MQRRSVLLSILLAPLLVLGAACGGAAEAKVADGTALEGTYDARCGCAIDSIGVCGNYVMVDGAPVELAGDLGLGPMEFCGQDGRKAHVVGTVQAAKVAPTEFTLEN